MPNIHDLKDKLANLAIARLGLAVFVNGVKVNCHISDDQFDDGSGYRRQILLNVRREDGKYFKENDSVVLNWGTYKIKRVQRDNEVDPFIEVELKLVQ